jgi:N-acetylmuramoyl-L-alanine amidase
VLDPGSNPGEEEIVYDIAVRIEGRLLALGASVFLTRGPQNSPSESERIAFTNANPTDLFISLHTDTHSNPLAQAVATYFYGSQAHGVHSVVGERFASLLQREISARTSLLNCWSHPKTWDLLRLTQAPSIRVDCGYLSNPYDAKNLATADFRDALAEAFIIAIQRLYLAAEDDAKTGTLRLSDLRSAGLRR